jgi:hypothetical protein
VEVPTAAVLNWYGFETPDEIAHGLWAQDYHTTINDIAVLGYNTIRIPFSNQMVEDPIVPQNLSFSSSTGRRSTPHTRRETPTRTVSYIESNPAASRPR